MENDEPDNAMTRKLVLCIILIALAAAYFRSAGVFRGMDKQYEFHPDVGKQIIALRNFLNDKYHWQSESPFDRGYPYALNHLDEMALRSVANVTEMADEERSYFFNYWWSLHRSVKVLRVLYGMVCLLLLYQISTFLLSQKAGRIAALFLFAVTPVAIDVSHFATGDIGVDLFSCLMLVFLTIYARTEKLGWLFISSFFVGVAFSCKYNGLFTGIALFLYFALLGCFNRSVRKTAVGLLLIIIGFLCGVLAATPAFFIVGGQHLDDIMASIKFIRQYGIPQEVLEQSFFERVWNSLGSNIPRIGRGFGMSVLILGLFGTGLAGHRVYRLFAERKSVAGLDDTIESRRIILCFSIFLYPFLALGASLVVKHAVMPFHFSYLAVPFVLAAAFVLDKLWSAGRWQWSFTAFLLFSCMAVEVGKETWQNNFFWQRLDNSYIYFSMPDRLENKRIPRVKKGPKGAVREIVLEPENSSFFRNRYHSVSIHSADAWKKAHVVPVPSIPYPDESEWIFLNGPVLPLNDRMFHVTGGWGAKTKKKQLVLYTKPEELFVGIRSGSSETVVKIELGGVRKKISLAAWDQKIISILPEYWKTVEGREGDNDIFFVPFSVTIPHHEIWVSLLPGERERAQFELFGGRLQGPPEGILPDIPAARLAGMVKEINYYSSDKGGIAAAGSRVQSVQLSLDHTGLAAGAYILSCKVNGLAENTVLGFQFRESESGRIVGKQVKRPIRKGVQFVHVPLEKKYIPYGCEISVTALKGSGEILFWQIKPDARKIIKDLKAWQGKGEQPSWLADK